MISIYYSIIIMCDKIVIDDYFYQKNVRIYYRHKRGDYNKRTKRLEDKDCVEITPTDNKYNLSDFIETVIVIKNRINNNNNNNSIDVNLYILLSYKDQCNYELSREELRLINELGCYITLSCYESDDLNE